MRTDLHALLRDEAGASAVEFALLVPMLGLLAAGTIDAGQLIAGNMEVRAAAQAGADYALAKGWNEAGVTQAVTAANQTPLAISASPVPTLRTACISQLQIVDAPATGACANGAAPARFVEIHAQAPFRPIVPWPGLPLPETLTARAQVRVP